MATPVLEVASRLKEFYNSNIEINITKNFRLGDIRHNFADLNKIKNKLGFQAQYNFSTGVAIFVEWVKSQDVMEDNYSKSIEEMKAKGLFK